MDTASTTTDMTMEDSKKPGAASHSARNPTHNMRITSGGSIQSYVRFALQHLQVRAPATQMTMLIRPAQDKPNTPLVLHTIPPNLSPTDHGRKIAEEAVDPTANKAPEAGPSRSKLRTSSTLHPCTLTTPRLISVVEIIKRDYLVGLAASGKGKGKHRSTGLWQYTESGTLPAPSASEDKAMDDESKDEALRRVLDGKTK